MTKLDISLRDLVIQGLTIAVVSYLLWLWTWDKDVKKTCLTSQIDNKTSCRLGCNYGMFSLNGMDACHPWLTCEDVDKEVDVGEKIGGGAVKNVFLGKWRNRVVVVNRLNNPDFIDDFHDGLSNLINLQGDTSPVVQIIGYCSQSSTFVSEYHPLKSGENIERILQENNYLDNLKTRYSLLLTYIKVILFLHERSQGTRVMCDSNSPEKALSQLLIRDDFTLMLNDADALPLVDRSRNKLIKCGHREITGDFVAPEQLWPFESDFDDSLMPGYDEKTDIWKIPDVCKYILNEAPGSTGVLLKLFEINSLCKSEEPTKRPSSKEVFLEYQKIFDDVFKNQ